MILHLSDIKDRGNIEKERIVFDVIGDGNLTNYLIGQTYQVDEGFDVKFVKTFWFTDAEANQGDRVVLYSKKGEDRVVRNKNNRSTFFYFWYSEDSIWNEENLVAVLINTGDFTTYQVEMDSDMLDEIE